MTPLEALDRAIARGGTPSLLMTRRLERWKGRPGEIIEKLEPEARTALRALRSDDIAEGKLSPLIPWYIQWDYGEDERMRTLQRTLMVQFDRQQLHLEEGPHARRRKPRLPN